MNIVAWCRGVVGRVLTAPGGVGGQCVDLINVYLVARGGAPVRANAADFARAGAVPGWRWVPNGPGNAPVAGDIVVWRANVAGEGIGPYGHIALAMAADSMQLLTLDQDWPYGAPVALVWHRYAGVEGWHTPVPGP
jgi:hypothetical protein